MTTKNTRNFTGDTNEVEVPIEVEENIDAFEKVPENTDVSPDDSVRIGASQLHHSHLIRTPSTVYMVGSMAVVIGDFEAA